MLAIALGNALWGRLLLGAMAPQSQSYLISLDGSEVGFATLTIERISQKEIKYAWRAELAISGDPCLRSIENSTGKTKLSDSVLPEELFVALAADIGTGCRKIRGSDALAQTGQGCWTEAGQEHAEGTLFGTPVQVNYGPDMMPASVRYPKLGLAYRSAHEIPDELRECHRTVADDGIVAPGGAGISTGGVEKATYKESDETIAVRRSAVALPPAVTAAISAVHDQELKSCREAAEALAGKLRAKNFKTRLVSGLLLDQGRYFPHAWVEVKLGKDWVPVDATSGEGAADASHLRAGLLGDFQAGIDLLKLLHSPPVVTVEQ